MTPRDLDDFLERRACLMRRIGYRKAMRQSAHALEAALRDLVTAELMRETAEARAAKRRDPAQPELELAG